MFVFSVKVRCAPSDKCESGFERTFHVMQDRSDGTNDPVVHTNLIEDATPRELRQLRDVLTKAFEIGLEETRQPIYM